MTTDANNNRDQPERPDFLDWPEYERLWQRFGELQPQLVREHWLTCDGNRLSIAGAEFSYDECREFPENVVHLAIQFLKLSVAESRATMREEIQGILFERENSWPQRLSTVRYGYDR